MKLYTEEQVLKMLEVCRDSDLYEHILTFEDILKTETPIELPSDEEIEQSSLEWFLIANKHEIIFDLGWIKIFEAGAKYEIDKIQGGNK